MPWYTTEIHRLCAELYRGLDGVIGRDFALYLAGRTGRTLLEHRAVPSEACASAFRSLPWDALSESFVFGDESVGSPEDEQMFERYVEYGRMCDTADLAHLDDEYHRGFVAPSAQLSFTIGAVGLDGRNAHSEDCVGSSMVALADLCSSSESFSTVRDELLDALSDFSCGDVRAWFELANTSIRVR